MIRMTSMSKTEMKEDTPKGQELPPMGNRRREQQKKEDLTNDLYTKQRV